MRKWLSPSSIRRRLPRRVRISATVILVLSLLSTLFVLSPVLDRAQANISENTRTAILSPNGNVTTTGWTNTGGSTFWDSVKEDPDNPNDTDYILGPNATNTNNAITFDLSDTPADFVAAKRVEIRARYGKTVSSDDSELLNYEVLDSSNASFVTITDAYYASTSLLTNGYVQYISGRTKNNKTTWDGARLKVSSTWTSNGTADATAKGKLNAIEVKLVYYAAPVPKLTQTATIAENDDGTTVNNTTQQAGANTALTQVKKGERMTARFQMKNTGGALDPSRQVGVFYDQNDGYFAKVRTNEPVTSPSSSCDGISAFDCQTVEGTSAYGDYSSMAFDDANRPVMAYYRASSAQDLRSAQYVGTGGTGCTGGNTAWNCTTVEATNNVGQWTSTAITERGDTLIAYYDVTNTDLRMAVYTGGGSSTCGGGSTAWDCFYIENDAGTTNRGQYVKLAVAPNDVPWMVYYDATTGDARYARYVGSGGTGCAGVTSYSCGLIDSGIGGADVGQYTSLAFDQAGTAWASYYDNTNNDLYVAKYVGSGGTGCTGSTVWTCTKVDADNSVGLNTSISINASGNPAVAYRENAVPNKLRYAEYVGGGTGTGCGSGSSDWNCYAIDNNSGGAGVAANLGFAPDGKPWILSKDTTNNTLRLARYTGNGAGSGCSAGTSADWVCSVVHSAGGPGDRAQLAFDRNGLAWFSTYTTTSKTLIVGKLARGGELSITPGLSGANGDALTTSHGDMSSATDTANRNDADCVGATTWNAGKWYESENGTGLSIPAGSSTTQCTEVAFTIDTSQATPGTTYRLVLATDDGSAEDHARWRGPALVSSYLTFTVEASTSLRASKDTQAIFSNCDNTAWGCVFPQTTGSAGAYSSIAMDPHGRPWAVYTDTTTNKVMSARYVGSGGVGCEAGITTWTCTTIDQRSTGDVNGQVSIKIAPDGTPWVSYIDNSNQFLRVARYVGSGGEGCASSTGEWYCSTVDDYYVTSYAQMAISPFGAPWIAYYVNDGTGSLKVAYFDGSHRGGCSNAEWRCSKIDSNDNAGQYASIAFAADGVPWVAYTAASNSASQAGVRVARYVGQGTGSGCTSGFWTCTKVISNNTSVIYDTSIVFDGSGVAWVAYTDRSGGAGSNGLRTAKYVGASGSSCTSGAWTCSVVDNIGNAAVLYPSMATDTQGAVWIAYRDAVNDDIRTARFVTSGGTGCAGSTAWSCSTVASTGAYAGNTSIAFDFSATPWITMGKSTASDFLVAKMHSTPLQPSYATKSVVGYTGGARWGDGRFHLDDGRSPRSETGGCSSNTGVQGYCAAAKPDSIYDSMTAIAGQRPVYTFAARAGANTSFPNYVWRGMSSVAPSTKTVTLEVFRFGSVNAWTTVATNSAAAASTNFVLVGLPSAGSASEYWEADGSSYLTYFRVVQAESTGSTTLKTETFFQNTAPNDAASSDQMTGAGAPVLTAKWASTTSMKFTANMTDTNSADEVQLCVEVKALGVAFTNAATGCGTAVPYVSANGASAGSVTINGLTDSTQYHWQAMVTDMGGLTSSWQSYGSNLESQPDFGLDTTAPTGGTVYDGVVNGSDAKYNAGDLNLLSANWSGFDNNVSGLNRYEYSVGLSAGDTSKLGWTSNNTATSVDIYGLSLTTNVLYFVNVRSYDNAGNYREVSSNGQFVAPTLSFTATPNSIIGNANLSTNRTVEGTITTTTSTNSTLGYSIYTALGSLPSSFASNIGLFNGGTYASPDAWLSGDTGIGFSSSDTLVNGLNIFQSPTCLGGNPLQAPGCYAPFSTSLPGYLTADHPAGTTASGEQFQIPVRITVASSQAAGKYTAPIKVSCVIIY